MLRGSRNLPALLAEEEQLGQGMGPAGRVHSGLYHVRLSNPVPHESVSFLVRRVRSSPAVPLAANAACLGSESGLQAADQAAACLFSPVRLWRTFYTVRDVAVEQ